MSKGMTKEVRMCGKTLRLGDYVEVQYTNSKMFSGIRGEIVELWSPENDEFLQTRVNSGWCFHEYDKIVKHIPKEADND